MGNFDLTLLPPQKWEDFESFLKGLVDVIWKDEGWQLYGRKGQKQNGIDLIGYDEKRRLTGIQAKKVINTSSQGQLLNYSLLTEDIIKKEIINAENFSPQLERLIFATTSFRDVKIQNIILAINEERARKNLFRVEIWFWEDLQAMILNHKDLMYFYFSDVLDKIYQYDKNEHILLTFRRAFSRPAFDRHMQYEESGGDFIEAIKDTMQTISTGKLYNREKDLIATTFDFTELSNENWRKEIRKIVVKLNEIRTLYLEGIQDGRIRQHETCLEIMDFKLRNKFDTVRKECLEIMNKILKEAKLDLIESELL